MQQRGGTMHDSRSTNGSNGAGRDNDGRFTRGNPGGPGNPYAQRTAQIRQAMLAAMTEDDVKAIVRALVEKAKTGDVIAAREVLNRAIGKPAQLSVSVDGLDDVPREKRLREARAAAHRLFGVDPNEWGT